MPEVQRLQVPIKQGSEGTHAVPQIYAATGFGGRVELSCSVLCCDPQQMPSFWCTVAVGRFEAVGIKGVGMQRHNPSIAELSVC